MSEKPPVQKIVQCQVCNKKLKYTGSKKVITCPACGGLVPIVDGMQYEEPTTQEPIQLPWTAPATKTRVPKNVAALSPPTPPPSPPPATKTRVPKNVAALELQAPQFDFTKPVPMHWAIIYCIWVVWAVVVLFSTLFAFTDFSSIDGGTVYTNKHGPNSLGLFIFANLFACTFAALFYAVFAAIPTYLIWNYHKLKSTDTEQK